VRIADLNHTSWDAKDGAPAGGVYSIAQTAEGFLWLASGVDSGLYRFDGHRFEFIPPPGVAGSREIYSLFAPKSGGLWVGYTFGGAAFFKDGHLTLYSEKEGLPAGTLKAFAEDSDGTFWAATTHGVVRLMSQRWQRMATLGCTSDSPQLRLLDTQGTFWVACLSKVPVLPKNANSFQDFPAGLRQPSGMAESSTGQILASDEDGVHILAKVDNPPHVTVNVGTSSLIVDRDRSLWTAPSTGGIRRIAQSSESIEQKLLPWNDPIWIDQYGAKDGVPGQVQSVLEDREGSIWLGTNRGLHRLSERNLALVLDSAANYVSISAADGGGLWAAEFWPTSPVLKFANGTLTRRTADLSKITSQPKARDGSIWFGTTTGLAHYSTKQLQSDDREMRPFERLAAPDEVAGAGIQGMAEDHPGNLWISVVRKRLFKVVDGHCVKDGGLTGLPNLYPITVSADSKGRTWLGYAEDQIVLQDSDNARLYSRADGLDIGNVTAIYAQRSNIWAGGERGLVVFDGKRFHPIHLEEPLRLEGITGIVETAEGDLWLNASTDIVHIAARELRHALVSDGIAVPAEVFGARDGLEGRAPPLRPHPTAIEGTDGKLWFTTNVAVFSLDPNNLIRNPVPPPVVITSLRIGDKAYSPADGMRLPENSTALRITYAG
jgi:ligand-binding sensor domain-containing protein